MSGIIDFHTHAFPDSLASKAMKALSDEVPGVPYFLDGRVRSLLKSMDRAGIERSVVASIATRAKQFEPILQWSCEIRSERLIPFPSVHPGDRDVAGRVRQIADEGFAGIKMHPYYQQFDMDEPRMDEFYSAASERQLAVLMHTGFDIAFERVDRAGPGRIMNVIGRFPELKLVTTHMGAWQQWDEVAKKVTGEDVYIETSYSLDDVDKETAKKIFFSHPKEKIIFGTDSPWADQCEEIDKIKKLNLGKDFEDMVFCKNALRLLGLSDKAS